MYVIFLKLGLRYTIALQICILSYAICPAQSTQIDSLKKLLPISENVELINRLNSISKMYIYIKKDSSVFLATEAFDKAKKINYAQGMGDACFNIGKAEVNFSTREKYFLLAVNYYEKSGNKDTLAQVYFQLGKTLNAKAESNASIKYFEKANQLFRQVKDSMNAGTTLTFTGLAYGSIGNYEKAFEYGFQALQVRQDNHDLNGVMWSYCNLARLFQEVEDFHMAIEYYSNKCIEFAALHKVPWTQYYDKIAECYLGLHHPDSARWFMNKYLSVVHDSASLRKILSTNNISDFNVGLWFLMNEEYDKALSNFFGELKNAELIDDRMSQMLMLNYLAQTFTKKGDNDNAIKFSKKLLDFADSTGIPLYIRNATALMWKLYDRAKAVDSAYKYHSQYIALRDSVSNYRFLSQMISFKETAENERKDFEFKRELERQSLIKKILIGIVLISIFIPLVMLRNATLRKKNEKLNQQRLLDELNLERLENEKKQTALQNKAVELEMQALRAQMNPHFIFNSLNSINRFIMQNNKGQASQYLTKFSRLVRLILQNSQAELITIESELESLELYLDLEALRFDYHFSYKISSAKDLDISILKVPPLIIQPYVENAIWHGLMHKEEKGQLDIEIYEENNFVFFRITDNGVGRKHASALSSKSATRHKSMGLRITADRIAMLYRSHPTDPVININDLVNPDATAAGTEVIIKIPAIYD